ncbi:MAG TPA: SIS domain-containing protein [Mycobacterium sp.]|nr:SIS domain-containing protein [Mycobacterium sp.]
MCGIVAFLPSYERAGGPLSVSELVDALPDVAGESADCSGTRSAADVVATWAEQVEEVGKRVHDAVDFFHSASAVRLIAEPDPGDGAVRAKLAALSAWGCRAAHELDAPVDQRMSGVVATAQAGVRALHDDLFAIENDVLGVARAARKLAGGFWTERSAVSYAAVATALDVVDRLELRGRDSAGVSVWIELADSDGRLLDSVDGLAARSDPLLKDGAVLRIRRGICFVYKRAAIIGRLGDNTAHLRAAIRRDAALHAVLAMPSAAVTVLAHTRWASVGRTSASNAHPVHNALPDGTRNGPATIAVLNGDVDNYVSLCKRVGYTPESTGVTTDAKLLPLLLAQGLGAGRTPSQAVADMLAACTGSMAVAVQTEVTDGDIYLAVKGSGQALYIGLSQRGYLVASEIYGLVGVTQHFFRVDGAQTAGADGAVVRLSRAAHGLPESVEVWNATGESVSPALQLRSTAVTSRDLALGDYTHYLDKELHDAPESFRRTLLGRVAREDGRCTVRLPDTSLPARVRRRLAEREITAVVVIGQGTAAVAAQGIAYVMKLIAGNRLRVSALPATEFSAWHLRHDMSDTLVVAVSQSGSTADTNRAVDLASARGSPVISIINRRDSDLAHKSDGVVYTSDGRDVELAVASTKAFYSQIAAGSVLGLVLGRVVGALDPRLEQTLVEALLALPGQLAMLMADVDAVCTIAAAVATAYPSWAVVGSGPNRVAANEIRIKLSELCYRAVAVDAVEDKKHIDLSAEALVITCAAGAPPNHISDLAKELEIFRAHSNRAVVICDADTVGRWPTDLVIPVATAHPAFAWVLATAAGHLLGYHAALAIDATARPLRAALQELERLVDAGRDVAPSLPLAIRQPIEGVLRRAASGELRGVLSSAAALGLVGILAPSGRLAVTTEDELPAARVDVVRTALETAIVELTRSIDTVKHQAKTVTVGTSRSDADCCDNPTKRWDMSGLRTSVDDAWLGFDDVGAPAVAGPATCDRHRLDAADPRVGRR